jgi:hypothetical protein
MTERESLVLIRIIQYSLGDIDLALYCTVLYCTCPLSKKGSGLGPFLRSSVGIQSMVDRIRKLSFIGGCRLSILRIRIWKPVLFDPGFRIQNRKNLDPGDKRSGSYFRESLVTGFKNTSILCQFSVADPNGIR